MGAKNKMVGLAHIAKLLKYGLSISLYKTFAALRYIIYIVNYQKFSITNKINLVKASLELVSADGDANSRNTTRSTVTNDSMNYRADMITASNKATRMQLQMIKKNRFLMVLSFGRVFISYYILLICHK